MYRLWEFVNFEREINLFFFLKFKWNLVRPFVLTSHRMLNWSSSAFLFKCEMERILFIWAAHGTAEMIESQQDSSSPCGISSSLFLPWPLRDDWSLTLILFHRRRFVKRSRLVSHHQDKSFFFPLFFLQKNFVSSIFCVRMLSIWCNNVRWGAYRSICDKKRHKNKMFNFFCFEDT